MKFSFRTHLSKIFLGLEKFTAKKAAFTKIASTCKEYLAPQINVNTKPSKIFYEVTVHTLSHLKCLRLVSVCSSLPCINIGVRIELTVSTFHKIFFRKIRFKFSLYFF